MHTAKVIEHEGLQLVLLPKAVHIDSAEVTVDVDDGKFVLTPREARKFETLADIARYMRENFPIGAEFPDIERAAVQQERDLFPTEITVGKFCHPERSVTKSKDLPASGSER